MSRAARLVDALVPALGDLLHGSDTDLAAIALLGIAAVKLQAYGRIIG